MSFHIVFLLQKQRAGTRERTFFRPGSLTRDSWSASKSVIIEVDEWSGDLRSIGMTQITWKGVDLHGTHTQHPGVYCCVLGNASSSSWHVISHRFTWVDTRGRGEKGDLPMKRSRYGEPDYAFGQLMLTLRTHMGLTQASLAKLLGISRRAVITLGTGQQLSCQRASQRAHRAGVTSLGLSRWARGGGDPRLLACDAPEGAAR